MRFKMEEDSDQFTAVNAALTEQGDRIITGGAGTGKTTIIRQIAEALDGKCEVMAPTGKAAARLKEATGFPAGTVHRALLWDGKRFYREGKLPVTIIDEASMVDSCLLAAILRYEPSKIILVGDDAQLAPVGKGQPFHDLIRLRPDIVSTLRTCHRAKGAVHQAANAIRQGETPAARIESGGEAWCVKRTGGPKETLERLGQWIRDGYYDENQDIILGPQYGNANSEAEGAPDGGIRAINATVKSWLNPSSEQYAPGDRVILNKNFSAEDLWNGDLGSITDMDNHGLPEVTLDRDQGMPRRLDREQFRELAHAWCLSVHKAQGSQFRQVFFCVFRRHVRMLNRPLIYTAVTRAQKAVVVCGETDVFYSGINTVCDRQTVMQALAADESIW